MKTKKYQKVVVGIVLLFVFCFALVFIVNKIFTAEKGGNVTDIVTTDESHFNEGYIEINVRPRFIDLEKEHAILELDFVPHGRFDNGDGVLSTPLTVGISSDNNSDLQFQSGRRMFPVEVEMDFYEGEVESYPFDEHRALLEILVIEQTSADGNWHNVPVKLNFNGAHENYNFTDKALPLNDHGYIGLDIHIQRSSLVIGTAIFLMAIIWGLTIVNLMILIWQLAGYSKAEFSLFVYMSGSVVAMFFFRKMFPDIPSVLGVFSDYLSIFLAVLIAALVAIVVAIKWLIGIFRDENKQADSAHSQNKGKYIWSKHYYPLVGEMESEGEEFECAQAIDRNASISSWIRNVSKSENSFRLRMSTDNFYPDFVALLNDGRTLVIEYKGKSYETNDDSKEKNNIGELWEEKSKDKRLFLFAVKRDIKGRDVYKQIEDKINGK